MVNVEVTKTNSLLNVGYKAEQVDRLVKLICNEIARCSKEMRSIDLILNNKVLRQQYETDEHWITIMKGQRADFSLDIKFWKELVNKISGESVYHADELK